MNQALQRGHIIDCQRVLASTWYSTWLVQTSDINRLNKIQQAGKAQPRATYDTYVNRLSFRHSANVVPADNPLYKHITKPNLNLIYWLCDT